MLNANSTTGKQQSLMSEYSSLLGDAILRNRTRLAERTARIESELANRVKSEFIANMSHELRTPLHTIIGFSKLLTEHDRRQLPEADVVQYATLINDAAAHLLSVINDILDISKMQSGRFTLNSTEVMIDEVLDSVIAQFEKLASEAGLSFTAEYGRELPPVRGDAQKLQQIFSNLISNAIKFTRSGGNVAVAAGSHADGSIVVVVRDSGVGMTPDELRVALQPFGQVDGSRTRWREGTGLGLSIANALVELHGGRLEITSEPGRGTQVAVLLPSRHSVTVTEAREAVLGHGTENR